jgi:hypothetical protein
MRVHDSWQRVAPTLLFLLLLGRLVIAAQSTESSDQIAHLLNSDPAVRASAKSALSQNSDPELVPKLLQALQTLPLRGPIRADVLAVLSQFDDPRKIPVFIAQFKASGPYDDVGPINDQLAHLGAPAAEALLASCNGQGLDYGRGIAGPLSWMHKVGAHYSLQAVLSDDPCRRNAGRWGLLYMFGDAEPDAVSRADIELAADAAFDEDEHIAKPARDWITSRNEKDDYIDFSGIVDQLIGVYQSAPGSKTMIAIAEMLSQRERPRVTRFMRAATHSPDPDIQSIANQYLATYAPNHPPSQKPAQ